MKIRFLSCCLFILFQLSAFAQITIHGKAPEYAGYKLTFYSNIDPVSDKKVELCTIQVAEDGSFSNKFNINKIIYASCDFDGYSTNLYLVPGQSYEILLPPFKKVTESQKRNPFFRPELIHLATKSSEISELNRMIREFEQAFQQAESRFFEQIYNSKSKNASDTLKYILSQQFPSTKNTFFEDYRFYRLGFIDFARNQGQSKNFIKKYFVAHRPNFEVAPCKNLFDRLFSNQFSQLANSIDEQSFKQAISKNSPDTLAQYFINEKGFSLELAQMVILKSIKDAFFQGQFSQKGLLGLLDKIQHGSWNLDKKEIAKRLKADLTYMLPGTKAPLLKMTTFDGVSHSLSDYNGQLVYLHFTRVENPICRKHLDELKKLPEAVLKEVKIINLILTDEGSKREQIEKQNWPGDFMVVSESSCKNWNVKSFPTAYLVSESGNLIHSPALAPLDGFARQIGAFLQKRHIEKLRNQAR